MSYIGKAIVAAAGLVAAAHVATSFSRDGEAWILPGIVLSWIAFVVNDVLSAPAPRHAKRDEE